MILSTLRNETGRIKEISTNATRNREKYNVVMEITAEKDIIFKNVTIEELENMENIHTSNVNGNHSVDLPPSDFGASQDSASFFYESQVSLNSQELGKHLRIITQQFQKTLS